MPIVKANEKSILKAAEIVLNGGVIAYPTDTVYGLGCDPFNEASLKKLLEVKRRTGKGLPVLAVDIENAKRIALFSKIAEEIANKMWPGSLTLILPKKESLPSIVTAGLNSIAVRVPNHKIALNLIKLCGGLIIGTSANISGEKPCVTAEEVYNQLNDKIDLILDGGKTPLMKPSTILDLTIDVPKILREASITAKEILSILKTLNCKVSPSLR
jgi:L-threonylcarbamoyladenylate synthase